MQKNPGFDLYLIPLLAKGQTNGDNALYDKEKGCIKQYNCV